MAKMSEVSLLLEDLKRCSETLTQISEQIRALFLEQEDPVEAEAPEEPEPPEAPGEAWPTFEEVRALLAKKSRARKENTDRIRELLRKYGADKLSEVKTEHYKALMEEAEVMPDA